MGLILMLRILKRSTRVFFLFIFSILFLPLAGLNKEVFYAKLNEPTPQWMIEQIEEDLANHKTDLSRKSIDVLFTKEEHLLVRVRVSKGKMQIQKSKNAEDKPTASKIIEGLYRLSQIITLPDIDFVFTCHDAVEGPHPIFNITKFIGIDNSVIVMPDMFALGGYEPGKSLILEGNCLYTWDQKNNMIFYRGSDFASSSDLSVWLAYPRLKLAALSVQYPDLIDAKFVSLYSPWPLFKQFAQENGYMGSYVSLKDHPKYKYLISVDAGCASTPRLPIILHSNSVVFKDNNNSILWFYKALKPYEHFIPVKRDLSDLLVQIDWAKAHDEECKKISENARKLAADVLTEESIYLYLYRLLEAYSNKQRGQYFLE